MNENITIYRPQFSKIDLVCGTRPEASDEHILFCGAAAFTRIYGWSEFSHDLIAGNHVASGIYHLGYDCPETAEVVGNTGSFVWYAGQWQIVLGDGENEKKEAAAHGGMGFSEELIIYRGEYFHNLLTEHYREKTGAYRVLADIGGELVIVESASLTFGAFVDELLALGVRDALFIDMGSVRYSFVRNQGRLQELYPEAKEFKYATNWIVFYK